LGIDIYDILLMVVIVYFLNRWARKNFGVSYWTVFKNFWTGRGDKLRHEVMMAHAEKTGEYDYRLLFEKFCRITEISPGEAFKLARDHMGFGFTDSQVERHLDRFIMSGGQEVPNYLEAFLDQGKDYIIEAKEYRINVKV